MLPINKIMIEYKNKIEPMETWQLYKQFTDDYFTENHALYLNCCINGEIEVYDKQEKEAFVELLDQVYTTRINEAKDISDTLKGKEVLRYCNICDDDKSHTYDGNMVISYDLETHIPDKVPMYLDNHQVTCKGCNGTYIAHTTELEELTND